MTYIHHLISNINARNKPSVSEALACDSDTLFPPKPSQPHNLRVGILTSVAREDNTNAASSSFTKPQATQETAPASSSHVAQASASVLLVTHAGPVRAALQAEQTQPAAESGVQQNLHLTLWNEAYDSAEEDEDTKELVERYSNVLAEILLDETLKNIKAENTTDISAIAAGDAPAEREILKAKILADLKDPSMRQEKLQILVEKGKTKVAKASKITHAVGDFAKAVLSLKPVVDLCSNTYPRLHLLRFLGLVFVSGCRLAYTVRLSVSASADISQILSNPAKATKSNLAGIVYVTTRMDWYCALIGYLLDRSTVDKLRESGMDLIKQRVLELYKAILCYQMNSVRSYYDRQFFVLLRSLANGKYSDE